MTLVVMSSTVGEFTSGSTYRVRAKTAEALVKAGSATKAPGKKITVANAQNFEGKRG